MRAGLFWSWRPCALAEGFELKSRDMVFVDPVPLVLTA